MRQGCLLVVLLCAATASAQGAAGVSDERVTLPGAPGSLDGMGSNAISEGNQGALTYSVAIEVPPGFKGLTPQLALNYSSNGGTGMVGIGWSLASGSIERRTVAGLQKYDTTDSFVADGSNELVKVSEDATSATYRARFEGGFARYTWLARATGEGGYWRVEMPDGLVAYYGADPTGALVTAAQVIVPGSTPARVFRWCVVAVVDPLGHQLRVSYTKGAGGYPLVDREEYVFDGPTARHSVRFTYQARQDLISDGRPGFELTLGQRLAGVSIYSGSEAVRAYLLQYETDTASGSQSRLQKVTRFGRGDVQLPVVFSFAYTQTLGATCSMGCDKPFVVDMGTIAGVDFSLGHATLVDINGDALPDVLYSDPGNRHHFYYAKLDAEGRASFMMTPHDSAMTPLGNTSFVIGDPKTQLLDLDGNGFTDIAQASVGGATGTVLCNNGSGDWVAGSVCTGVVVDLDSTVMPDDTSEPTQAAPMFVRFFDYDNDRRIDWLRTFSGATSTQVLANTPAGFVSVPVDNIGATFDEDLLQLADMNGDGLQDPVMFYKTTTTVELRYRLNLGRGTWSAWKYFTLTGLTQTQADLAEITDINGDGLADIVAVTPTEVLYALNRNNNRFDPVTPLSMADLAAGSSLPARGSGTTVIFADMNGNGSEDVVWVQGNGHVEYLELFPVRPNLITRIDNGLGAVQVVTYGSSVAEQARDAAAGKPWSDKVPHAAALVKQIITFVTLTGSDTAGLREITTMDYHRGYYDGVEKQFRGYETVEQNLLADMSRDAQEPSVIATTYDLGKTDPLFAGASLIRKTSSTASGQPVLLQERRRLFEACPVASAPAQIRFLCERAATTVHVERDPANAVTTRLEKDYDGYGNVIAERDLGVVHRGFPESPMACSACTSSGRFGAPCGAMCLGDEWFVQREYAVPGANTQGAWFLRSKTRVTAAAVAGMIGEEELTFYDGPAFDGLPAGQVSKGLVSRVMTRKGPGPQDFIAKDRRRFDAHGNAVESLEPNASPTGSLDGRELLTFDGTGLNLLRIDQSVAGASGMTALRTDVVWDTAWEKPSQTSHAYPVAGNTPLQPAQLQSNRYDEHGRTLRQLDPGETDATASLELEYALAAPASRVLVKRRSSRQGPQDLVSASCFDGKGRKYQERKRLTDTRWQVDGFTEFDARGRVVRRHQPYLGASGDCDMMPPQGVLFTHYTFDALGRPTSETYPDGSMRRTEYLPLGRRLLDEHDTDAQATFTATPTVRAYDGHGRLVSVSRLSQALGTGTPAVTRAEYDALGNIAAVFDPEGNLHSQTFGQLGRLKAITDPNRGTTQLEYDDDGNQVRRTDARAASTRTVFDPLDRPIERYDEANRAGTRAEWTYDFLPGCTECTNSGNQVVDLSWGGPLAGAVSSGYDPKGRLIYSERRVGAAALVTRHRYDDADRPASVTWPGGLVLDRSFDGADRVTALGGVADSIEYDDRGDMSRVRFSNGVRTEYAYDARRRATGIRTLNSADVALLDLGYTWNARGDLLGITDGTRAGRARHAGAFTYDAYGRLVSASLGRDGDSEVISFGYDELDNITSKTSSLGAASPSQVGSYAYDPLRKNAVSAAGGISYSYDAIGALVGRADLTLTRDALGRIVSASRGELEGTYAWVDATRVAKVEDGSTTLYLDPDFEVRDGIASAYARVDRMRLGRLQTDALAALLYSDLSPASGTAAQLTVTGDGTIDVSDAWLAQASSLSLVQLAGGPAPSSVDALLRSAARRLLIDDVTFLHADHLRTSVLATAADGSVRAERSFDPTGEPRSSLGFVDAYGFTGGEPDQVTGLLHLEHRDLDTHVGRWDRPDPAYEKLGEADVVHTGDATTGYAYVRNAMTNAVDPTGLWPEKVAIPKAPPAPTAAGLKAAGAQLNKTAAQAERMANMHDQHGTVLRAASLATTLTSIGLAIATMLGHGSPAMAKADVGVRALGAAVTIASLHATANGWMEKKAAKAARRDAKETLAGARTLQRLEKAEPIKAAAPAQGEVMGPAANVPGAGPIPVAPSRDSSLLNFEREQSELLSFDRQPSVTPDQEPQ